ncbi:hypothetical protein ACM1RC_10120 [Paenibacillus azoreducens]|uniref:hypothetical protein n=1 Tax=Paenibacillus azoreducens TaxID=116718 RepID=UPI0039F47E10
MGLEKVLEDIERKGEQKAKEEITKRMIDMGLEISLIARVTGFTPDLIEQMCKNLTHYHNGHANLK